jgi:hypothetical protein
MKILSSDLTYFGDVDLYFEVVVNFLLFSNIYRIYVCFFRIFIESMFVLLLLTRFDSFLILVILYR